MITKNAVHAREYLLKKRLEEYKARYPCIASSSAEVVVPQETAILVEGHRNNLRRIGLRAQILPYPFQLEALYGETQKALFIQFAAWEDTYPLMEGEWPLVADLLEPLLTDLEDRMKQEQIALLSEPYLDALVRSPVLYNLTGRVKGLKPREEPTETADPRTWLPRPDAPAEEPKETEEPHDSL